MITGVGLLYWKLYMYACVVIEEWLEKVKNVEGAGTHILYRLDKQLFRRNTNKGA